MSGRRSREKGARFEREALAYLKELGFSCMRSRQFRVGGADDPDIMASIPMGPTLKIECKSRKDLPSKAHSDALQQATDTKGPGIPIVMIKRPGKGADDCTVEMRADGFFELVRLLALAYQREQRKQREQDP